MARRVADAAEGAGAEVRVRHVAETRETESFAKNPAWTLAAVACLAIGIGANTTVYTAMRAIVIAPVPTPNSDRLVTISETLPRDPDEFDFDKLAFNVRTAHGGQETTLLALYITLMHFGGIIVPPGYTEGLKFVDGNPYGVSHITGRTIRTRSRRHRRRAGPPGRRVVAVADLHVGDFGHRDGRRATNHTEIVRNERVELRGIG
jgi:NAD(P)H dehydrogenase (quinone)